MLSKEIAQFSEMRYEIRAYLCFLLQKNIANNLPRIELNKIVEGLHKISSEVKIFELLYVLDSSGNLAFDAISPDSSINYKKGQNHNDRSYFYRSLKEKQSILTDPYPSSASGNLVVTISYPLYTNKGELMYIVCMDIPLDKTFLLVQPMPLFGFFVGFRKFIYFVVSIALFFVSLLLLIKGSFSVFDSVDNFMIFDIQDVFEATILITLSLAIFDLVRAIFEEEVLGRQKSQDSKMVHKTMIRFLGSIVIALAIEALMLVFKFTIIEPEKLIYAVYLIGGVTLLLVGLSLYMRFATNLKRDN